MANNISDEIIEFFGIFFSLNYRWNLVLHRSCPSKSGSRKLRKTHHKHEQRDVVFLGFSNAGRLSTSEYLIDLSEEIFEKLILINTQLFVLLNKRLIIPYVFF